MYLTWDEYFMAVSLLSGLRSKDPNTKVGACIVNEDKRFVGVGYNGMPKGLDHAFPWEREGDRLETKYPYVVHGELNAILNSTKALNGCTIYVSLFPCCECAKAIVQAGIKEVVYLSDKYCHTDENKASKHILRASGVSVRQLSFNLSIVIQGEETKIIRDEKEQQDE